MATPWTPAQRLAAYRAAGIKNIVAMPGWRTHNRDDETGKTFGPVHGVLIHHTAGVGWGLAGYCRRGSGALPGPLCHDFLAKDGTLYLVGHGRTNHAGTTTGAVKDAIINEHPPGSQRTSGAETVDANDFLHGLEIENEGDGRDPYPAAQMAVAVRWAAAHLIHYGWGVNSVWGHKEITTRKVDPSFSMAAFRTSVGARVHALQNPPEPPASKPPVETTVSCSDFTRLSRPTAQQLIPGSPWYLSWTVESVDEPGDHGANGYTFISEGRQYHGVLSVYFEGLPEGAFVEVRGTLITPGQPDSDGPTVTVYGQGDGSEAVKVSVPFGGRTGTGQSFAFELVNGHTGAVTLAWAGVTAESQLV